MNRQQSMDSSIFQFHGEMTDTQDLLYILGLEQRMPQLLFLAFSNKQWQNMDSPQASSETRNVEVSMTLLR